MDGGTGGLGSQGINATQGTDNAKQATQETQQHPFYSRLKSKYTDKSFEKDTDYHDAAEDTFNEYESKIKDYDEREKKWIDSQKQIQEMVENVPGFAEILRDVKEGSDLLTAIARNYDTDAIQQALASKDGDPDFDKWHKARAERQSENKKKDAVKKAWEDSDKWFTEKFIPDKKLEEASVKEFLTALDKHLGAINEGRLSDVIPSLFDGINSKKLIQDAVKAAVTKAKNEKIVEKKETEKDDNIPHIDGSGKTTEKEKKEIPFTERFLGGAIKHVKQKNYE